MGGSSGSAGGGGSSGAVEFPSYMKEVHKVLMGGTTGDFQSLYDDERGVVWNVDRADQNNPYLNVTAYDPEIPLANNQSRFAAYLALVEALDENNLYDTMRDKIKAELGFEFLDWSSVTDEIVAKADSLTLSDTLIEERVSAFADSMTAMKTNTRTRYNGLLADIGAVMSSAFTLGNSMLEQEHTRQLANFETELRIQNWVQRIDYIKQSVRDYILVKFTGLDYLGKGMSEFMSLLDMRLRYEHNATQLLAELNRVEILANKEEIDRTVEIEDAEARWPLEIYQYAANVLGAIGGGTAVYKGTSGSNSGGSNLGGALSGALTGASIAATMGMGAGGMAGGAGLGALAMLFA